MVVVYVVGNVYVVVEKSVVVAVVVSRSVETLTLVIVSVT